MITEGRDLRRYPAVTRCCFASSPWLVCHESCYATQLHASIGHSKIEGVVILDTGYLLNKEQTTSWYICSIMSTADFWWIGSHYEIWHRSGLTLKPISSLLFQVSKVLYKRIRETSATHAPPLHLDPCSTPSPHGLLIFSAALTTTGVTHPEGEEVSAMPHW